MNTLDQYIPCLECEGDGYTTTESVDYMNNIPQYTHERCEHCNGEGEIENEDYCDIEEEVDEILQKQLESLRESLKSGNNWIPQDHIKDKIEDITNELERRKTNKL